MAKFEKIFCENCGAPINADVSQQYVKCDSCGAVVNNSKYSTNSYDQEAATEGNSFGSLFTDEAKSGINKIKSFFVGFGRHDDSDDRRNPFDDRDDFGRRNHHRDYYAVIEKTGLFYKGECPGISFTNSGLCDSYDECLREIEEKLGDKIGSFNKIYEQPDPRELDLDDDQRIVRVRPRR